MENTVTISLNLYNELRDFKEKALENGICFFDGSYGYTFLKEFIFYTKEGAILKAAELNNELINKNTSLSNEIDLLKNELASLKEKKVDGAIKKTWLW